MTPTSGCRDIERLSLEREVRELDPGEKALVESHLASCGRCRGFAADRELIRAEVGAVTWPALPEGLDRRTRRLAREVAAGPRPAAARAAVPAWLLVALAVVTIVTGIGLAAALADVTPETTMAELPPVAWAAVFIVLQNALTLLFAPVVLRTFRARREETGSA